MGGDVEKCVWVWGRCGGQRRGEAQEEVRGEVSGETEV